jgi:dihydrofolate reductase
MRAAAPRRGHNEADPHERKDELMKLTINMQVSVDGVVQGNGGLDPAARRGGFERGGWARPPFDSEAMTWVGQFYQRADAFLFGRLTYELFAGYWGVREDLEDPIVGALNTKPKYVASNTLTEARWADTTVLSGDLAAAIGELKAKPGVSCRCTAAAP